MRLLLDIDVPFPLLFCEKNIDDNGAGFLIVLGPSDPSRTYRLV